MMKYIVRLNLRAYNPLTRQVIANRLWEVEQAEKMGGNGRQDSERVVWHCAAVRIDQKDIEQIAPITAYREFGKPLSVDEKPWELEVWGVCVRGQDNAIEIHTGKSDVSGN